MSGCGGQATPNFQRTTASLPAATAKSCIAQSTQAQTTALPAAGGVTGTISIGAGAESTGPCLTVAIATGSAVLAQDPPAMAASARKSAAQRRTTQATGAPQPLTEISLTDTYTGNLTWIAVTLNLPPGTVPAGQYPATITSTLVIDGTTDTTVANFTVTVSANGTAIITGPNAQQFLAVLAADTTGTLAIYPPGTVLATPTPFPTAAPSTSPSPAASPTATPSASPAPTVAPTASPTAAPVVFAPTLTVKPNACIDVGNSGGTFNYTVSVSQAPPPGYAYEYSWITTGPSDWGLTVPGITSPTNFGLLGTSTTASVMVPTYPQGSGGVTTPGASGGIEVSLWVQNATNPGFEHYQGPNGQYVVAGAALEAGTITCASVGL